MDCILESVNPDDIYTQRVAKEAAKTARSTAKDFLDGLNIDTSQLKKNTWQLINNSLEQIRLPLSGERIRIRTQQSINLIGFILKIIEVHGIIEELTITTYTLNRYALSIISDLVKTNKIIKLNILLASAYSFRKPEYYRKLKTDFSILSRDGFDVHLVFAWAHFKVTLAKCGGDYYQHEGSMNYSDNNMAEQLSFENNKAIYDYDYDFIINKVIQSGQAAIEVIC